MIDAVDTLPTASLYYREGGSDKVYHASIERDGDGYVVNFAFGRRGSALQTGSKTQCPVSMSEANEIFGKLVLSKLDKGYRVVDGAVTRVQSVHPAPAGPDPEPATYNRAPIQSMLIPTPLLPIERRAAAQYIADNDWGLMQKHDGKFLMLSRASKTKPVLATNKLGKLCGAPSEITEALEATGWQFVLAGEGMGDTFCAYNLRELEGQDCRALPYAERYNALIGAFGKVGHPIRISPLAIGTKQKKSFFSELERKEGAVFVNLRQGDVPGSILKCKFIQECSAVVIRVNAKRSVEVAISGVSVGNVTIPPNHEVPAVGMVVEVQYLYAYKGGCLYQPVYKGERDDVRPAQCTVELQRIKYKVME